MLGNCMLPGAIAQHSVLRVTLLSDLCSMLCVLGTLVLHLCLLMLVMWVMFTHPPCIFTFLYVLANNKPPTVIEHQCRLLTISAGNKLQKLVAQIVHCVVGT